MSLQTKTTLSTLVTRGLIWHGESLTHSPPSLCRPSEATHTIPFGLPEVDAALPHHGLLRGAIHEMFYQDPLQPRATPRYIPALLAHNAHISQAPNHTWSARNYPLRIIWIGRHSWPTPYTFSLFTQLTSSSHQTSLLDVSLFIDPPNDKSTLWAIEMALRSPAINLIIATCPRISLTTTKRLALIARTCQSTALLLRHYNDITTPSCAATKWHITPSPSETPTWELSLSKIKGNGVKKSSWLIGIYEKSSDVSLRVLPRVVNCSGYEEVTHKEYGT